MVLLCLFISVQRILDDTAHWSIQAISKTQETIKVGLWKLKCNHCFICGKQEWENFHIKEIYKSFIERGFALQNCAFKFENRWKTNISRTCSQFYRWDKWENRENNGTRQ